ncbi:uncharacterized protein LOC129900949 isoform X2 [Solanum dulcamara]|nr:uncharacterized protein LOC129900949 isoform X2 [Solanum dulcamara]
MEHMARLKVLLHQCCQNRDEYYILLGEIFMLANYCEMQQVHDIFVRAIGTLPVSAEIVASQGVQYLEHLLEEWRIHSIFVRRIGWIFNKMEKSMNVNVHQLCSQRFIDNYMDFGKVAETILGGERINGLLMRNLRRIMIESKVYTNEEEKAYESVSMILQDRIVGHILEEVADHGDPSLSVQILNGERSCHSSETSGILPQEASGIWNRLMIRYQRTGRKLSCQLNKGTANMIETRKSDL